MKQFYYFFQITVFIFSVVTFFSYTRNEQYFNESKQKTNNIYTVESKDWILNASPYFIIDCGRSNSVYTKNCFSVLNYFYSRLLYSGKFQKISSVMNLDFLDKMQKNSYTIRNFYKKPPYRYKKLYKQVMLSYKNLYQEYIDKQNRYVLIEVIPLNSLLPIQSSEIQQAIANLERKNIVYYHFKEKEFINLYNQFFAKKFLLFSVQLDKFSFSQDASLYSALYDTMRKIKLQLQREPEVQYINTPIDFSYSLATMLEQQWKKSTVWKKILTYHELLPMQYYSLLDPLQNTIFIKVGLENGYNINNMLIRKKIQERIAFYFSKIISKKVKENVVKIQFIGSRY